MNKGSRAAKSAPSANKGAKIKKIIINAHPWEVRVAHLENDLLSEYYVERVTSRTVVGNIYKGKVVRVLPGMQAAFLDIGLERTAFLYVSEIVDDIASIMGGQGQDFDIPDEEIKRRSGREAKIQDLVKEGQELLVQVTKEPMGTKGARLTCHITLPGRSVVLMPTMNHVGVSRRIPNEKERRRLKDLVHKVKRPDEGVIVRTASEGQPTERVRNDILYLQSLWNDIRKKAERTKAPGLVFSELGLALRAVRDLLDDDVNLIAIDDAATFEEVRDFVKIFAPDLASRVEHFSGDTPIFESYKLESEIARAMEKKVWLKSGGYLIIEQTEALAAIDVNTGRFVGNKNLDETILKTNMEAVNEIVYQLRFRNIGGIIILDFIDMDRAADREKVYRALEDALKADKARTNISRITSLGLVEMTRKRTQENLGMALTEPCPMCKGSGRFKSRQSVVYEMFRIVERESRAVKGNMLYINLNPEIANYLMSEEKQNLKALETRIGKRITIHRDGKLPLDNFEVHG